MTYVHTTEFSGLTRPIVDVWKGLLKRAQAAKQRFCDRSDQVMSFFSGGPGFMWSADYMNRFMGGPQAVTPPRFKITLNIAFEQVAILGPLLFWEMSDRKVSPHRSMQLDPMTLAGGNEQAAQYFQQLAQQQANDDARNDMRAQVLEHILNYLQREQPGGGLAAHSDMAVFEALTKGVGFLKTEPYKFPFSDKTYVGSFFESCDNVLVDPDCMDPLWHTADWIAIRHKTRCDVTEEHFGLPKGALKQYATVSSQSAAYQVGTRKDEDISVEKDLVEWFEIFSRAGFGNRLVSRKQQSPIAPEFDDVRGSEMVGGRPIQDSFVYLCICPSCDYPLNLPGNKFGEDMATPEWIKQQTDWPTPYWRDNKWPVEPLWFYPTSGASAWPEPPLSPALGEMTCLNILMSAYVQEAFEGRQSIICYKKGAVADLQGLLTSDKSPLAVELDPQFGDKVNDVINFMKRPEINGDLMATIQFLREMIERRTGLSSELYGSHSGATPRSATDAQNRMDTVNARPEFMQKKVAAWQSNTADKEVFCAYMHMASSDIAEQLGPLGVAAWDELVTNESPESILRGARCIVEASAIRRPNKTKDMADLQGMQQYLLPILAGQMAQTGDVNPINGFIKAIGQAGEFEVDEFLFPPPQPDEQQQQLQQAMQQAELSKTQAAAQKLSADAQKSMADAQATGQQQKLAEHDAQLKAATAQHAMQIKQQTAEHALSAKERTLQMDHARRVQEMEHKDDAAAAMLEAKMAQAKQELGLKLMAAHQQMHQDHFSHLHSTAIEDQRAMDDARRGNLITYQKILNSRAERAARAQPPQGLQT